MSRAQSCSPLRRTHHRHKAHGGYTARVSGPGRFLWTTPHGQHYLVDHTGTTRLTPHQADVMHDAPDGVEIYLDQGRPGLTECVPIDDLPMSDLSAK